MADKGSTIYDKVVTIVRTADDNSDMYEVQLDGERLPDMGKRVVDNLLNGSIGGKK